MQKKSVEEAVTSLHDLSAVDLIAGYRAKQFSPSEVLEDVLTHVAAWEPATPNPVCRRAASPSAAGEARELGIVGDFPS